MIIFTTYDSRDDPQSMGHGQFLASIFFPLCLVSMLWNNHSGTKKKHRGICPSCYSSNRLTLGGGKQLLDHELAAFHFPDFPYKTHMPHFGWLHPQGALTLTSPPGCPTRWACVKGFSRVSMMVCPEGTAMIPRCSARA